MRGRGTTWNSFADEHLSERRGLWDCVAAIKVVGLLVCILLRPNWVSHDCALYLQIGDLLLQGRQPYIDYVELNPPLIHYLNVIPAFIARTAGLNVLPVFLLCVLVLVVCSALVVRYLLARAPALVRPGEGGLLVLTLLAASEGVFFLRDFGQREHLFLLLYIPFAVLRWQTSYGVRTNILVSVGLGVCAGVGLSLKPHFLLGALVVELYVLASSPAPQRGLRPQPNCGTGVPPVSPPARRRCHSFLPHDFLCEPRRFLTSVMQVARLSTSHLYTSRRFRHVFATENVALSLTVAAYLIHFLFLPPEVLDAFFGRWLPLIVNGYSAYGKPFLTLLVDKSIMLSFYLLIAVLTFFATTRQIPRRRLNRMFAIFTICMVGGFLIQAKDWFYQLLPATFGLLLCLGLLLIQLNESQAFASMTGRYRSLPVLGLAFATPFLAAGHVTFSWFASRRARTPMPVARCILENSRDQDPVLFISTSVSDGYPDLVWYGRRPASRYLVSFPIALFYKDGCSFRPGGCQYHTESDMSEDERLYLDEMAEDIRTNKPVVIAIKDSQACQGCPAGFNVLDYLRQVGFISNAMDDYVAAERIEELQVFVLRRMQ